ASHPRSRGAGSRATAGKRLTADQVESRRRTTRELDLGRYLQKGYDGPWWTKDEVALLGRLPDEEVARRTGRSVNAVRQKREAHAAQVGQSQINRRRGSSDCRSGGKLRLPSPTPLQQMTLGAQRH